MRTQSRVLLLVLMISPIATDLAMGQPDDAFDDVIVEEAFVEEAPVRRRPVGRRGRGILSTPLTWAIVAGVLAVAVPLGVLKIVQQFRHCQVDQDRPKAPWERAQAEFEREQAAKQRRPDAF